MRTMKLTGAGVLVGLGLSWAAWATDFPPAFANNTVNATLLSAGTNASATLFVERSLHHTCQMTNAGSAAVTVYLDRGLDGSTWTSWSTNSLAAGGTGEATAIGKWSYFRARLVGTNTLLTTVNYLGGR